MAKKLAAAAEINLLPSDDLENRPGGAFLRWALTWGKRVVTVTELVVILAFLSRFWLDTTLADTTEEISHKRAVVVAEGEFEREFRQFSQRMDKARKIEEVVSPVLVLEKVESLIPRAVSVGQVTVNGRTISMVGGANEVALEKLVTAFKKSVEFSDIFVERVSQRGLSSDIDFSLRALFVGGKT